MKQKYLVCRRPLGCGTWLVGQNGWRARCTHDPRHHYNHADRPNQYTHMCGQHVRAFFVRKSLSRNSSLNYWQGSHVHGVHSLLVRGMATFFKLLSSQWEN